MGVIINLIQWLAIAFSLSCGSSLAHEEPVFQVTSQGKITRNDVHVVVKGMSSSCLAHVLDTMEEPCFSIVDSSNPSKVFPTLNQQEMNDMYAVLFRASPNTAPSLRLVVNPAYYLDVDTKTWTANRSKFPKLSQQYRTLIDSIIKDTSAKGVITLIASSSSAELLSSTFLEEIRSVYASNPHVWYESEFEENSSNAFEKIKGLVFLRRYSENRVQSHKDRVAGYVLNPHSQDSVSGFLESVQETRRKSNRQVMVTDVSASTLDTRAPCCIQSKSTSCLDEQSMLDFVGAMIRELDSNEVGWMFSRETSSGCDTSANWFRILANYYEDSRQAWLLFKSHALTPPPAVVLSLERLLKDGDDDDDDDDGGLNNTPAPINGTRRPPGDDDDDDDDDSAVAIGVGVGVSTAALALGFAGFLVYSRRKSSVEERRFLAMNAPQQAGRFLASMRFPTQATWSFGNRAPAATSPAAKMGFFSSGNPMAQTTEMDYYGGSAPSSKAMDPYIGNGSSSSYGRPSMSPHGRGQSRMAAPVESFAPPPRQGGPTLATVVYDYRAGRQGELSLMAGNIVEILQRPHPGWYEGRKIPTGEIGKFPDQCVRVVSDRR